MSNKLPSAQDIKDLLRENRIPEAIKLIVQIDEEQGIIFARRWKALSQEKIDDSGNAENGINLLTRHILEFVATLSEAERNVEQLTTSQPLRNKQGNKTLKTDPFIATVEATLHDMKAEISGYFREAARRSKCVTFIFLEHKIECLRNYQKSLQEITTQSSPNRALCSQHINELDDALEELKKVLTTSQLDGSPIAQLNRTTLRHTNQVKDRILHYLLQPGAGLNTSDFSLIDLNLNQLQAQLTEKMENARDYS